ncbi:MAG TPA: ABC transporter ATP-binding protein [Levilinea sp.]|nr:ABC transporter ATP-binding protein [Levilinea sp.]
MELIVNDLCVSYSFQPALRRINFRLHGGVVALLGPNGSGKTTLLRCLATAQALDCGEMRFAGLRYDSSPAAQRTLRAGLGFLPQDLDLPGQMTPLQLLQYLATLKGIEDTKQPERLLVQLGLNSRLSSRFDQLSGGQVRLAGIAQAFLGQPYLVLLDELTRGLDVQERQAVFRLLRRRAGLVIFSTHVLWDVEQIADQVVVLHAGQVLFAGELDSLYRQTGHFSLEPAYLQLITTPLM